LEDSKKPLRERAPSNQPGDESSLRALSSQSGPSGESIAPAIEEVKAPKLKWRSGTISSPQATIMV